jgi:hypothetical protein
VRDFDGEGTDAEVQTGQNAARPRQRNRRGRRSRQLAYQRWQQRLQQRARMARGLMPPNTPQQQQQTQRTEALPVGTPQTPPAGQQKEKLSNQATGGQPVETGKFCAAISAQITPGHESAAKSMQSKPQRRPDHPSLRHAENRPVAIVRPMVAHEGKRGRDTSPAVILRLPRTEPRALQQQQQIRPPPLPLSQQLLSQMGRGERLRYMLGLAERASAARTVGTIRNTSQPSNQGNSRNENYQLPPPLRGPRHLTRPAFTAANVTQAIASLNLRDEENRPYKHAASVRVTTKQCRYEQTRSCDDATERGRNFGTTLRRKVTTTVSWDSTYKQITHPHKIRINGSEKLSRISEKLAIKIGLASAIAVIHSYDNPEGYISRTDSAHRRVISYNVKPDESARLQLDASRHHRRQAPHGTADGRASPATRTQPRQLPKQAAGTKRKEGGVRKYATAAACTRASVQRIGPNRTSSLTANYTATASNGRRTSACTTSKGHVRAIVRSPLQQHIQPTRQCPPADN